MCSFSLHAYRGKQNRYRRQETLRKNKAVSKRHFYSSVLLSIPSVSLFSIIKCKPQNHFIFSNESLSFTCKSNISTFPGPWWKWLHSNIDVLIYIYILEVVDDLFRRSIESPWPAEWLLWGWYLILFRIFYPLARNIYIC